MSRDSQLERYVKKDFLTEFPRDFEAFYTRSRAFYYSVVYHILRQPEESEDALQKASLKLWLAWEYAPTELSERRAWAYTIVRNCAIDRWRSLHHSKPRGANRVYPPLQFVSLEKIGGVDIISEDERDPQDIVGEQETRDEWRARLDHVLGQLSMADQLALAIYRSDLPYKIVNRRAKVHVPVKMRMRKYRDIKRAREIALGNSVKNDRSFLTKIHSGEKHVS